MSLLEYDECFGREVPQAYAFAANKLVGAGTGQDEVLIEQACPREAWRRRLPAENEVQFATDQLVLDRRSVSLEQIYVRDTWSGSCRQVWGCGASRACGESRLIPGLAGVRMARKLTKDLVQFALTARVPARAFRLVPSAGPRDWPE